MTVCIDVDVGAHCTQSMHVIERQYFISSTSSAIAPVFGAGLAYGELPDMTLYVRSPFLYYRLGCWYTIVTITTTGYIL